jgi:hypothetical protein
MKPTLSQSGAHAHQARGHQHGGDRHQHAAVQERGETALVAEPQHARHARDVDDDEDGLQCEQHREGAEQRSAEAGAKVG